jgi:hypothetical protein|tara:strand:+ start:70 stop:798 length:729 start_codon:yes stop_codon:yes gene_type:complete
MAVNIDTVYQRVLAVANKEQRGYVTPQEFNLYANQVQMDIFEQYFYDLNAFQKIPGNDSTYADMVDVIQEKIDVFEKYRQPVVLGSAGVATMPDYYRMGELYTNACGEFVEIEKLNQNEVHHILSSPLTTPSITYPVYVRTSGSTETNRNRLIQIYPTTIASTATVVCNYIARPATAVWGYTVVNNQALYNSSTSTSFELHPSEESELVVKILELAGVSIKDPMLTQFGTAEEAQNIQQENK